MAIIIPGTLVVEAVQGRKGVFHVAKLTTSIGEFSIKHSVLMRFAPGEYQENFVIEQIKIKAYEWHGGATSYVAADLDWAALELFAQQMGDSEVGQVQTQFEPCSDENGIIIPAYAQTIEHVTAMVGNQWEQVNLGEYILSDRESLQTVRNLLKEAGYRFQPQDQTWHLSHGG